MTLRDYKTPQDRREALEKELSLSLPSIGSSSLSTSPASEKNCENMIGFAQIPLGVAGPLRIKNSESRIQNEKKEYYVPLATTEGALVASINRGMKAISESGGAVTHSHKVGMTRGPVFYTGSIKQGNKLWQFVKDNEEKIAHVAEATSSHLKLKKIKVKSIPNYTFVRLSFDTQDAMGMNMVTIATEAAVRFIEQETGIQCLSVAGNFDIDKKPAWLNSIEHRGIKVWAEVVLTHKILTDILKTDSRRFFDTWLAKVMLGSAISGSIGFNAHIANAIAALFLATGQDPAHVVEGSLGLTTANILENGDLYVGIFLPSLLVGTVGGGTGLPTQSEALEMLGVKGQGNVMEFAEIVGATVLAGEISLLASLSEGSLGKAHQKLGRVMK